MYSQYFVTGAAGFLGHHVVACLCGRGAEVHALILPGDRLRRVLPESVSVTEGDVTDAASLERWLAGAGEDACVIHCASVISIASRPGSALERVNVEGTRNVLAACQARHIAKLVYVSSVHAIPEKPAGEQIGETRLFSARAVAGPYAKSKAEATALVLSAAEAGLNASVVHPSGILGPGDNGRGSMTGMLISYCLGKLPAGVRGGYDFVDVRDVAEGVVSCAEKGQRGECYILSGRYVSVREMLEAARELRGGRKLRLYVPQWLAKLAAPFYEWDSLRRREPLYFTPYAIEVLGTNSNFTHDKATRELGYTPRTFTDTMRDTLAWLKEAGFLKKKKR